MTLRLRFHVLVLKTCAPVLVASLLLGFATPVQADDPVPLRYQSFWSELYGASIVDPSNTSGAFETRYDLASPPGRLGLEPSLSLSYNSRDTDPTSVVGYGWSLSIPSITRISKTGTTALYTSGLFSSSLDGELASTTGPYYGAKFEKGDFRLYEFASSSTYWIVTDKRGVTYTFGETAQARQDDPADSSKVYRWMLEEVRDQNGNFIRYEYYKDQGQIYPSAVIYTGHDETDGIFEIDFTRENRSDLMTSGSMGFHATTSQRIAEVQAKINNSWVKKYALSYSAGVNGARSLLSGVAESGRDSLGTITSLPTTTYTYQAAMTAWTASSTPNVPGIDYFVDYRGHDLSVRFIDKYGDGILEPYQSSYGNDYQLYQSGAFPHAFTYNNGYYDHGTRIFDINGDGLADFLRSIEPRDTGGGYGSVGNGSVPSDDLRIAYLQTSNGQWATSTDWDPPQYFATDKPSLKDMGARFGDFNGDGLVDIARGLHESGTNPTTQSAAIYTNSGQGWLSDGYPSIPRSIVWFDSVDGNRDNGLRFADLNGDGLTDVLRSIQPETTSESTGSLGGYSGIPLSWFKKAYINTGNGWQESTAYTPSVYFVDHTGMPLNDGIQFLDVNGDGLDDMIYGHRTEANPNYGTTTVAINTGSGFSTGLFPSIPTPLTFGNDWADNGLRFVDIDYDGLLDAVRLLEPQSIDGANGLFDGYTLPLSYFRKAYLSNGVKPDLLVGIADSRGTHTAITYKSSISLREANGSLENPDLPYPMEVVSKIETSDGVENTYTDEYDYRDGDLYYSTALDRAFGGFGLVTKTDATGAVTKTYFHQGNGTTTADGETLDGRALLGEPYRIDVTDLSGNVFERTLSKWRLDDIGNGRAFASRERDTTITFDGDADHADRSATYAHSTTTGNLIERIEWGDVSASTTDGSFTDAGSDKRITEFLYASRGATSTSLVYDEIVEDNASTTVKRTKTYYDGLSFGSADEGNPTTQELWKTGSSYATTTRDYDAFGLVATSTDARGKSTTFVYDAYNLYPATTTQPHDLVTAKTYDYSSGNVVTATAPNGGILKTTYDGLGRPTKVEVTDPANPTGALLTKTTYTYNDSARPTSIRERNYLTASLYTDTYHYSDGLGREVQTRKLSESAGTYAVVQKKYDALNRIVKEYLPAFFSGSSYATTTQADTESIRSAYDPLGRLASMATNVGTTTSAYDQRERLVTDARGKQKKFVDDAFGRLARVDEYESGNTFTTTYAWNANSLLASLTDALGNIRNFTYDGLSRLTKSEDLHAPADTGFASTTLVHDDAGNVLKRFTDQFGETDFTYDDLNRPLTEDSTAGAGTEIAYAYDTCAYGKGYVCAATTTDAATTYAYDVNGKVESEQRAIGGSTFTTSYDYDRQGNPTLITYADSYEVKYNYNAAGLLEQIGGRQGSVGSYSALVSNFDYAPTGATTLKQLGNGVRTTYTYDPSQLYRLTNITTRADAGEVGGTIAYAGGSRYGDIKRALESFLAVVAGDLLPDTSAGTSLDIPVLDEPGTSSMTLPDREVREYTAADTIASSTTASPTSVDSLAPIAHEGPAATSTSSQVENNPAAPDEPDQSDSTKREAARDDLATRGLEDRTAPPEGVEEAATNLLVELASSTGLAATSTEKIAVFLEGKTAYEKATLKGQEIAKIIFIPKTKRSKYSIEVVSTKPINGGVEVFARAWDEKGQIGFGRGGTVDMERFRIFNPPVLVPDEQGDIVQEWIGDDGKKRTRTLREDPQEALLQVIEHNLSVMKNIHGSERIVRGKRGNTTSTFYPDADPESTSVDGRVKSDGTGSDPWSTIRNAGTGTSATDSGPSYGDFRNHSYLGTFFVDRAFVLFDTSALGDTDDIVSATLSLYKDGDTVQNSDSTAIGLTGSTPASDTSITTADFDALTLNSPTEYASRYSGGSIVTNSYNNMSLNANGLAAVSKTGVTKFALRLGLDIDNTQPSGLNNFGGFYSVDQSGSTQDPKLVVEHVTSNAPTATSPLTEGQTNPGYLNDPTPEFSAVFEDADSGDLATKYQIQVSTTSDFSVLQWDSASTTLASSTPVGQRIADISYAGSALASSTTYYWRIKFWDDLNAEGAWSAATSTFSLAVSDGGIQNISFTYDAVGNILSITDVSDTDARKTVVYTYDDLNRLLTASTTAASSTPYQRTYAYNALGNLTAQANVIPPAASTNTHSTDLERDSSQYWSIADGAQAGLDITGNLSISLWFKPESAPAANTQHILASKYLPTGNNRSYIFYYEDSGGTKQLTFGVSSDGTSGNTTSGSISQTLSAATWYHLAVVYTAGSGSAEIFVNGSSIGTISSLKTSIFDGGGAFQIGNHHNASAYADGLIDDARIWSRALSGGDVSSLHSAPGSFNNGSSLEGWWKFDNDADDDSGNGNTLDNNNSATFSTDAAYTGSSPTYESHPYAYDGTGYANPHAPTAYWNGSATTTYSYDNNGNMTAAGPVSYTWDWRNRLIGIGAPTSTSYGYDQDNVRVFSQIGSAATTTFANKYFNQQGATTTKHVFTPSGDLIATIEGNGAATSTRFIHTDHLGGTNAVSDSNGAVVEVEDPYPFGLARISQTQGVSKDQRQYAGTERDFDVNLDYMVNRYYSPDRGQFLSQDPAFLAIGDKEQLLAIIDRASRDQNNPVPNEEIDEQQKLQGFLSDPQLLNSYAYAKNNPVTLADPEGEITPVLIALGFSPLGAKIIAGSLFIAGGISTGIDLFEYGLTQKYQNAFDDRQKSIAQGKAILSTAMFVVGFAAKAGEALLLEAGGLVLDIMEVVDKGQQSNSVKGDDIKSD